METAEKTIGRRQKKSGAERKTAASRAAAGTLDTGEAGSIK